MHLLPLGDEEHLFCPLDDPFGDDEWTDLTVLLSDMAHNDEQYLRFVQQWDDNGDPPNGNGPWSLPCDWLDADQIARLLREGWQLTSVVLLQVTMEGDTVDDVTKALVEQNAVFNYITHKALVYHYLALHPEGCDCSEHQH